MESGDCTGGGSGSNYSSPLFGSPGEGGPPPEGSPSLPKKKIKNQGDVEVFRRAAAAKKVRAFIEGCCRAVRGVRRSDVPPVDAAPVYLRRLHRWFDTLEQWVREIPLHDMAQQRFGNKAFRDFHAKLDASAIPALIRPLMADFVGCSQGGGALAQPEAREATEHELFGYLKDSFGNASRIDYGTGHELHFFILLMIVLEIAAVPSLPEEEQVVVMRIAILQTFWRYIDFMRMLQGHYSLEPAGSHGVWGLDDYHHLPFIFGAAQLFETDALRDEARRVLPKHITERALVNERKGEYLYFAMVAWIMENKKGPFHEHSSVLYNVSGIDEWARIEGGMIKMYDGEVLSKYAIMQHLLFGPHFSFD